MFVVFKSMRKKKTIKLQLKIKIGYLCRKFKFGVTVCSCSEEVEKIKALGYIRVLCVT